VELLHFWPARDGRVFLTVERPPDEAIIGDMILQAQAPGAGYGQFAFELPIPGFAYPTTTVGGQPGTIVSSGGSSSGTWQQWLMQTASTLINWYTARHGGAAGVECVSDPACGQVFTLQRTASGYTVQPAGVGACVGRTPVAAASIPGWVSPCQVPQIQIQPGQYPVVTTLPAGVGVGASWPVAVAALLGVAGAGAVVYALARRRGKRAIVQGPRHRFNPPPRR